MNKKKKARKNNRREPTGRPTTARHERVFWTGACPRLHRALTVLFCFSRPAISSSRLSCARATTVAAVASGPIRGDHGIKALGLAVRSHSLGLHRNEANHKHVRRECQAHHSAFVVPATWLKRPMSIPVCSCSTVETKTMAGLEGGVVAQKRIDFPIIY